MNITEWGLVREDIKELAHKEDEKNPLSVDKGFSASYDGASPVTLPTIGDWDSFVSYVTSLFFYHLCGGLRDIYDQFDLFTEYTTISGDVYNTSYYKGYKAGAFSWKHETVDNSVSGIRTLVDGVNQSIFPITTSETKRPNDNFHKQYHKALDPNNARTTNDKPGNKSIFLYSAFMTGVLEGELTNVPFDRIRSFVTDIMRQDVLITRDFIPAYQVHDPIDGSDFFPTPIKYKQDGYYFPFDTRLSFSCAIEDAPGANMGNLLTHCVGERKENKAAFMKKGSFKVLMTVSPQREPVSSDDLWSNSRNHDITIFPFKPMPLTIIDCGTVCVDSIFIPRGSSVEFWAGWDNFPYAITFTVRAMAMQQLSGFDDIYVARKFKPGGEWYEAPEE